MQRGKIYVNPERGKVYELKHAERQGAILYRYARMYDYDPAMGVYKFDLLTQPEQREAWHRIMYSEYRIDQHIKLDEYVDPLIEVAILVHDIEKRKGREVSRG